MFKEGFTFSVIKGGIIAFFCLIICIVVFAGVMSVCYVGTNTVKIINQFIKTVSVFFGCFFGINKEKGLMKGALIGLTFSILSNLFFLIIYREAFVLSKAIIDAIFISAISAITGLIIVNFKN